MALNGGTCQHSNTLKNGTDEINSEGTRTTEMWEIKFTKNLQRNLSDTTALICLLKHDNMFRSTKTTNRPPLQTFSKESQNTVQL